ncbi:MAG: signal peptidase I [Clostridiales bacterium]|jgi:signal peptidase I|nr:signal peptidase I [Clostridiales bacterium]
MAKRIFKEIISWTVIFAIVIVVALLINRFVFFQVKVPSGSMENTIMTGDRVFTLRLSYMFNNPERGDIVVFPFPDNEEVDYIKRIVGVGGDKIEIKDGILYINDEEMNEDYLLEPMRKQDFGPVDVPEGYYFMMGDNRNVSEDARAWDNQFVNKAKIKGKAIFKYPDFAWLNK